MDEKDLQQKALAKVLASMGEHSKSLKAQRLARPAKALEVDSVKVSPVEGGPTLAGVMGKPGNSGKEIVDSMGPDAATVLGSQSGDANDPVKTESEGGATLLGLMGKKGNSGKEIADESSISPEELEELLSGAK